MLGRAGAIAHLTRRQFTAGAGAVAIGASLPAQAIAAQPAPQLSALTVSALDVDLARQVRHMLRMTRVFSFIDFNYFTDERCRYRWVDHYWPIVHQADKIYGALKKSKTPESRAVLKWLEGVIPSEASQARKPWRRIEGLSRRGEWLQAMFEEALIRRAEVRIAFVWISRNRYQNPSYPDHAGIVKACDDSSEAVRTIAERIRLECWPAKTRGDLELLRRGWECRLYRPQCFEVKYQPKVRERHRQAGICAERLEPAAPSRDRGFAFRVPDQVENDSFEVRRAKRSALRVNAPATSEYE